MAWKVIESKHGEVVRTYERQTEWAAINVAIKIARREGLIRADDAGEDFMGFQCSWTLDELREQLEEFGEFDADITAVEIVFEKPTPKTKAAKKDKPKQTKDRSWSFMEATRTLPYVRRLLGSIREHYIAAWQFRRLLEKEPGCGDHRQQLRQHVDEGRADVGELNRLGVIAYDAVHAIALFPFTVLDDKAERIAYFVYREGRRSIDTFVFHDGLTENDDLPGTEQKIPQEWKTDEQPVLLKTAVKS